MKRPTLWLIVLVILFLGIGVIWYPGYEPYRGPNGVTCSVGVPTDPFRVPKSVGNVAEESLGGTEGFVFVPIASGMTIRDAVGKARFQGVDLNYCVPAVQRWASWSSRRATNQLLELLNQLVHRIPVEVLRVWWEEYTKGRGYESWDYDELPSSEVSWETPVRPGDHILLLRK